jgi:hypothetical protein
MDKINKDSKREWGLKDIKEMIDVLKRELGV